VYTKSRIQLQLTATFFLPETFAYLSFSRNIVLGYLALQERAIVCRGHVRVMRVNRFADCAPNIGRKKTAGLTNRHPILLTGLSISVRVTMKYVEESLDEAPTTIAGQFMSVDGKPPVHY